MNKTVFKGSGVALITPYDTDNNVNIPKLKELIEIHIKAGTNAVVLCGTTGESPALTKEEKLLIFEEGVKCAKGRIPIIAGTGSNNTKSAVELSLLAQNAGVDGLLLVTPYYNKTTQKGLISHFLSIADSVSIPMILYTVPSRTGMDIELETYKVLAKHKNICAVKEASGNIEKILAIKNACVDMLDIYSGNDELLVPSLAAGCIGVISVAANIIPYAISALCRAYLEKADNIYTKEQLYWQNLFKALFSQVNPIPVKEAMNFLGYNVGKCRAPLTDMDNDKFQSLINILKDYAVVKP